MNERQQDGTGRRPGPRMVALACVLALTSTIAAADHYDGNAGTGSFNPGFEVVPDRTTVDTVSGLSFRAAQADHRAVIRSYEYGIPAGWRLAPASIDPSALSSCRDARAFEEIDKKLEYVGLARIILQTNTTRDPTPSVFGPGPGPAWYTGGLWFLRWDAVTNTATVCAVVTQSRGRSTPGAPFEIAFQITLRLLPDNSGEITFNLDSVPGAPAGERSITDNAAFRQQDTSVLEVLIKLSSLSGGNFNRDPAGSKTPVVFSQTPLAPGTYGFTGRFVPCAAGDPTGCGTNAAPVTKQHLISITNFPVGYHPAAKLTYPALHAVVRGTSTVPVTWTPPATEQSDSVKGYVLTASVVNKPGTYSTYLISDPASPGYQAATDPCVPSPSSCTFALVFPLTADGGQSLQADNVWSVKLVTVFKDGHRSDGRCDDGTPAGSPAPCSDASVPASASAAAASAASVEFLLRTRAWPLAFQQRIFGDRGLHQSYVLFADLEAQMFEFVVWKPLGVSYTGAGNGVTGSNVLGGAIAYAQFSSGTRFGLQAVLAPFSATGLFEIFNTQAIPTSEVFFQGQKV